MEFGFDDVTIKLRDNLQAFMDEKVIPAEPVFAEQLDALSDHWAWTQAPILADLKAEARARGLWNLFLPGEHGAGLTNLQYAPLAEIMGRSLNLAPPALNCSAPDTGNMEVLAHFGIPGAEEALAAAAAGRGDPLRVRYDRAGGGLLRR